MRNKLIILAILYSVTSAHAFSPRSCTPEDLKIKKAGFEIYRKKSYIDEAALFSSLVAISPGLLHSSSELGKHEGNSLFSGLSLIYTMFVGSWAVNCANRDNLETPAVDIETVRSIYDQSKRAFWIAYALSAVSLYSFATESVFEDRRNMAKIGFLIPLGITFLGDWNLVHSPKDIEIRPLLVSSSKEFLPGLSLVLIY